MQSKKHKRKNNHVVIVTSEAANAGVKQIKIKPWVMQTVIIVLCVILGAMIGYIAYEDRIWEAVKQNNDQQKAEIEQLKAEKEELQNEINNLNEEIQYLSDTVNEKVKAESELSAMIESQSMPTEYPLTGSASMEEITDGDPICVFNASAGTTVKATASGKVIEVSEDTDYGYCVKIDHNNGYVTIYKNKGDTTVKVGDDVVQGTTLFIIGDENGKFGYQIMLDGEYINPMDVLVING